jgi:hypothetical protein
MSFSYPPPMCTLCERWVPGIKDPEQKQRCRAFPDGIPDEIWEDNFDHRAPLEKEWPLFKMAPDVTQEDVDEWEQAVTHTGADQVLQDLPDDEERSPWPV